MGIIGVEKGKILSNLSILPKKVKIIYFQRGKITEITSNIQNT